jgi:hypothetical protein
LYKARLKLSGFSAEGSLVQTRQEGRDISINKTAGYDLLKFKEVT